MTNQESQSNQNGKPAAGSSGSFQETPMNPFTTLLLELDTLYHAGDLEAYEHSWHTACQHAEHFFPGFTIAYAELYNSGSERIPDGSMHHVLVPKSQGVE
jgi:hypothetical protein